MQTTTQTLDLDILAEVEIYYMESNPEDFCCRVLSAAQKPCMPMSFPFDGITRHMSGIPSKLWDILDAEAERVWRTKLDEMKEQNNEQ